MMYQNYPYGIFNQDYLRAYQEQQKEAQRQWEQNKNIIDMVKAISDYCEAARKVDDDFRQAAFNACLAEILRQAEKDNRRLQA